MANQELLGQAFYAVMQRFISTGQGPHFTELSAELSLPVEEGRQMLRDLVSAPGVPGWLHPETDYLVSFAPFNNLPTQYRISVAGEQKWFAQWGFEALAVRWLSPGKTVRVEAPCLDCDERMDLVMRDEEVLSVEPETMVGYAYSEIGGTAENRPWR